VWYSPSAIYFGIRAYQNPATVRATLADRDKITGGDCIEILLDTFHDGRQALVFGVNPLGVQADGTVTDAAQTSINITSSTVTGAYGVDLSPDFVYESKGRLTAWGYEVELKIPFKTLRYPSKDPQDWGLNIIRSVQATGHQHTWTRVLQTNASFLGQSGTLTGLRDLHRGLVLDATPEATNTVTGSPAPNGWRYGGAGPRLGATVRWGVTTNLSLNATARPDFSQIEADVPQIQFDPRVALFFPEKRPFFLDGLELFQTPLRLIYTRRLVDPVAAVKLTGKAGANTIALLSGVDGVDASESGRDHPVLNALRLRHDLDGQNSFGIVYTDRVDGPTFNRVAAGDGRIGFGGAWLLTFQGGGSVTRDSEASRLLWGPVWRATLVRSGRSFGLTVQSSANGDDFRTTSGFLSRGGFVQNAVIPSYTIVGGRGSWFESFTSNVFLAGTWNQYRHFSAGNSIDDRQADFSSGLTLHGGWQIGTGISVESFGYPSNLFSNYWVERVRGSVVDTIPFVGTRRLPNLDYGLNLQTPNFQSFSLSAFLLAGRDENFFEWANGHIAIANVTMEWRPTDRLRSEVIYDHQSVKRIDDGSTVSLVRVPRIKIEYQVSRPILIRLIGQYTSNETDSLRDDSRTGGALLIRDPASGTFARTARTSSNVFRVDWLFSYHPTPGTVGYLGYGNSMTEASAFHFQSLSRVSDGFFAKLSYLFRL
jgi:hypothetical protein